MISAAHWVAGIGGVLQIVGVSAVALEIRGIRRRLHPDEAPWWRRLLPRRRVATPATSSTTVVAAHGVDDEGPKAPTQGAANQQPISPFVNPWHWRNEAEQLIAQLKDELETEVKQVSARMRAEREATLAVITQAEKRTGELDRLVRDLSEGDIRLRLYGVIAIIVGIALTTWPDRIADLWSRFS